MDTQNVSEMSEAASDTVASMHSPRADEFNNQQQQFEALPIWNNNDDDRIRHELEAMQPSVPARQPDNIPQQSPTSPNNDALKLEVLPGVVIETAFDTRYPPAQYTQCYICNSIDCPDPNATDVGRRFFAPCRCAGVAHRHCYYERHSKFLSPSAFYSCGNCLTDLRIERIGKFDPDDATESAIRSRYLRQVVAFWLLLFFALAGTVVALAGICWAADQNTKNIPIFFRMISSSVAGGSPTPESIEASRIEFKKPDTPTWHLYGAMGVLLTALLIVIVGITFKIYESCCAESEATGKLKETREESCCTSCHCCDGSGSYWGSYYCWWSFSDGGGGGNSCSCCNTCVDVLCLDVRCCDGGGGAGDCGSCDGCCDCGGSNSCRCSEGDCGEAGAVLAVLFIIVAVAIVLSAVFIIAYFAVVTLKQYHSSFMHALEDRAALIEGRVVILGRGEKFRPVDQV